MARTIQLALVKLWAEEIRAKVMPAHQSMFRLDAASLVLLVPQPPFPPWVAVVGGSFGSLNPSSAQHEKLVEITAWPVDQPDWHTLARKLCSFLRDFGMVYQQVWVVTRNGKVHSASSRRGP